jgi:transcriptional regulator with XRE-family HTH domain
MQQKVYTMRMTLEEIRETLEKLGWSQGYLAEKLCMHPVALNAVLSGRRPLKPTLAAHIELLLNNSTEQLLIFKVSYPDAICERWVPGWERLTEEQRVQAVEAVLQSAAEQLAADYERTLPEEDRAMIRRMLGGLRGPSHVFDLDAEAAAAAPGYGEAREPFA